MADACSKCSSRINERNSPVVKCDLCNGKFHLNCTNLSKQSNVPTGTVQNFLCEFCRQKFKALEDNNTRLSQENSLLRAENSSLKTRLDVVENQLKNLKSEIKSEILAELGGGSASLPTRQSLQKEISDQILEGREREKRRLNLCIRNLPEASGNELPKITEFISAKLGVDATELSSIITHAKRMGEPSNEKPRVCIITCSSQSGRRKILQNAHKLNKMVNQY